MSLCMDIVHCVCCGVFHCVPQFIPSVVDEPLDSTVKNILIHLWAFLLDISRSRFAGSQVMYLFRFSKYCHSFQSSSNSLH